MKNNDFKEKYYGPNKIENVVKLKDKTYFGKERIKLEFENKENIELPLEMAELVVSKDPKDLTKLVGARVLPTISRILALLAETELTFFEINNHVLDGVDSANRENVQKANKILWGGKNILPDDERTLLDVDKILLPEKYENTKSKH